MPTGLSTGRALGFALAVSVIAFLAIRVGGELMDGLPVSAEASAEEAPVVAGVAAPRPPAEVAPPVGLRVGVNDRIHVAVQLGGEPWFEGYLCPVEAPRCDRLSPLKVPPSSEIAIELSDLSHARLVYKGRRVEPLGNLVASRRLVFVDDAGS